MFTRLSLASLLLIGQVPTFEVDFRRDALETSDAAYLLGPDLFVMPADVASAKWSGDGQYLAISQKHESLQTLHVWSRKTKQVAKVTELAGTLRPIFQPKARFMWVVGVTDKSTLIRFDLSTMKGKLVDIGGAEFCDVAPDPASDRAVIVLGNGEGEDSKTWLLLWQPSGARVVQLPKVGNPQHVVWTKRGPFLGHSYGAGASIDANDLERHRSASINFETGELTPSTYAVSDYEPQTLYSKATTGKIGKNAVRGHWLFGMEPKAGLDGKRVLTPDHFQALIAADTKGATVSPDGTAVAYWDRSNLFAREVTRIDLARYEKDYEEWEKKRLTENAKQVAMSMAIYCSDSDDRLPINDGQFERLFPYSRDPSVFDGFSYQLGPNELGTYSNRDQTILGTMAGRFGRAVVYLDFHVIWDSRKKP